MELATYFFDHFISGFGNGIHGHGREGKRQHTANQQTDDNIRRQKIDAGQLYLCCIRNKEGKCGQSGGTDGKAFTHGSCGVADSVKLIGDLTHMGIKTAHLGNTAGVVGDRAISVNGNRDACGGEHADSGKSNTVKVSGNFIGYENANADQNDGNPGTHHADGDTADDRGSRAGLRLIRDTLDGTIIAGGINFCHISDHEADNDAGNNGNAEVDATEEIQAHRNGKQADKSR